MQAKGEIALLRARNSLRTGSEQHIPREEAWQHTEVIVNAVLNYAAERAVGLRDTPTIGYMLYGARAINAHIKEQGLHIETKDYDFIVVCENHVEFAKECKTLLWNLQQLIGKAVTADASTPGYLHVSVYRNRVVDLAMVATADAASWNAKYGPVSMLSTGARGAGPPVAVMPWLQLVDRLVATTTGDATLAARCFPLGFDPRRPLTF